MKVITPLELELIREKAFDYGHFSLESTRNEFEEFIFRYSRCNLARQEHYTDLSIRAKGIQQADSHDQIRQAWEDAANRMKGLDTAPNIQEAITKYEQLARERDEEINRQFKEMNEDLLANKKKSEEERAKNNKKVSRIKRRIWFVRFVVTLCELSAAIVLPLFWEPLMEHAQFYQMIGLALTFLLDKVLMKYVFGYFETKQYKRAFKAAFVDMADDVKRTYEEAGERRTYTLGTLRKILNGDDRDYPLGDETEKGIEETIRIIEEDKVWC